MCGVVDRKPSPPGRRSCVARWCHSSRDSSNCSLIVTALAMSIEPSGALGRVVQLAEGGVARAGVVPGVRALLGESRAPLVDLDGPRGLEGGDQRGERGAHDPAPDEDDVDGLFAFWHVFDRMLTSRYLPSAACDLAYVKGPKSRPAAGSVRRAGPGCGVGGGSVSRAAHPAAHPLAQVVPFTVNAAGFGVGPGVGPVEPELHAAAGGDRRRSRRRWSPSRSTRSACTRPTSRLVICWPAGNVNPSFQPVIAALLPLVILTDAVKPVFQSLVVYLTVHTPGWTVGVGVGVGVGVTVGVVAVGVGRRGGRRRSASASGCRRRRR